MRPRFGRTALIVQAVVAVAFAGWLLAAQDPRLPWSEHVDVTVELADAGGLRDGSRALVTVAGVPAGKVEGVTYRDGRAIAAVRLDDEAIGRVRRGARATVQPRSALNDLVLDLSTGAPGAPALRDGDVIGARDTSGPVALDEVLEALDVDARAALQVLVAELDAATAEGPRRDGRGSRLRAALAELDPVGASASAVARRLAGRRTALVRLTDALARLGGTLAEQAAPLSRVLGNGRATLDVLARRDAALAATVGALPATLGDVRATLEDIQRLSARIDPALTALRPAARALPAALDELDATVPGTRALVAELRRTSEQGGAAASQLRRTLRQLGPVATALGPSVQRAQPIVEAIDRNRDGIGLLGERFTGIFSTGDANGAILRGLGFFEPFDPANFGVAGATGAQRTRVAARAARALTRVCRADNPLACVVRYLVPGLPDAVRTATDPLGSVPRTLAGARELLTSSPTVARRRGLTPRPTGARP